jgi:hypothetical protein
VGDYIDPEELPFTADEVYRAGLSFLAEREARLNADHLAGCGPGVIEAREERRLEWRRGGILNADVLPLLAWVYPAQLLPALAELSSDVASRVDELRARLAIQAEHERRDRAG